MEENKFLGEGKLSRLMFVRDLVLFVPLICILPIYYGVEGILFAAPIADAASVYVIKKFPRE